MLTPSGGVKKSRDRDTSLISNIEVGNRWAVDDEEKGGRTRRKACLYVYVVERTKSAVIVSWVKSRNVLKFDT